MSLCMYEDYNIGGRNITNGDFNGDATDLSMMFLSAERYALGRKTYIVQWTCEVLGNNMHFITERDKKTMIRDIENCENYGEDFDKKEWMKLLKKLKGGI